MVLPEQLCGAGRLKLPWLKRPLVAREDLFARLTGDLSTSRPLRAALRSNSRL